MTAFFSGQELVVLEEELRNADKFLYMPRSNTEGLSDSLKLLSLRTGWAIYHWGKGVGLANLKNTEPPHNKTQDFDHAVEFAAKRKHFSVFVFPVVDKNDWLDAKLYLTKHGDLSTDVVKYLFIVPKGVDNRVFEKHGQTVSLNYGLDGSYVLRNGQWVDANAIS